MKMRLLATPTPRIVSERGQIIKIDHSDLLEEIAREFGFVEQFDPRSAWEFLLCHDGAEAESNGRFGP